MNTTTIEAPKAHGLDRVVELYFKLLEVVLVLCLGVMVVMVLGNVVLRYGFNSGITVSEELSRFLFVWLTFLGAVVGMRQGEHLGVDTVVRMLPVLGRKVCLAISEALMLMCCVLFFVGAWRQHDINVASLAPVTGLPMEWVYGVAYVSAGSMAALIVAKLVRLFAGRLSDDELIQVVESEEHAVIEAATHQPADAKQPFPSIVHRESQA